LLKGSYQKTKRGFNFLEPQYVKSAVCYKVGQKPQIFVRIIFLDRNFDSGFCSKKGNLQLCSAVFNNVRRRTYLRSTWFSNLGFMKDTAYSELRNSGSLGYLPCKF
jgi:hypothetical protein